jgi:hypothetical protein
MNWLNLDLGHLRSERFMEASAHDIGTWLRLMAYCAHVENGGVIRDGAKWDNDRWLRSAGVRKEDVDRVSGLWKHEVGHIKVAGYPAKHEKNAKRLRRQSVDAANTRWKKVVQMPPQNATRHA